MKLRYASAIALVLATSPAFALKITNLDKVPHTVQITGNGDPQRRVIQPDATEYFTGSTTGTLSLLETPEPAKKGKAAKKPTKDSVVHADGMLSGIIGNERDSMPADADNNYVIWPGGDLRVQSRVKRGGTMF